MGFISAEQLQSLARPLMKSGYGKYLLQLIEEADGEPQEVGPGRG